MVWSKVNPDLIVKTDGLIYVFVIEEKEKGGKWLYPRVALSIKNNSGTMFIPGSLGRLVSVSVEDVRLAFVDDELDVDNFETPDQLDTIIDYAVNNLPELDVCILPETNDYDPDFDHDGKTIFYPSVALPNVSDYLGVFCPQNDQYYFSVVPSVTADAIHVTNFSNGDLETLNVSN